MALCPPGVLDIGGKEERRKREDTVSTPQLSVSALGCPQLGFEDTAAKKTHS